MKINITKRFLLSLCLMTLTLLCGENKAWASDVTVTSTFKDKNWSVGDGEPSWTSSGAATYKFESRGVQITLTNIKGSGLKLSNSSIKDLGNIKSITLTVSANGIGGKISSVKVGSTSFLNNGKSSYTVASKNDQTVTFETGTPIADDIVISFSSTATSKSLYIKSIAVTYEEVASTPAPKFSLTEGTYNGPQHVTITAPKEYTEGIVYTTDGNDPTTSGIDYPDAGIDITTTTTLRAVAYDSDINFSGEATAKYTITYNEPTFSHATGTYYGDQSVTISVADLGSGSILYTTDGTDPKTNGTEYTEAISLPVGTNLTLKAVAKYGEELFSEVTEATYDIQKISPSFYQRVTSTDELTENSSYLIVCKSENVAFGEISNSKGSPQHVTITGDKIDLSADGTGTPIEFTLESNESGYLLKNSTTGNYIVFSDNGGTAVTETTVVTALNISFESDGSAKINNSNSTTRQILYHTKDKSSTYYVFGNYASSNIGEEGYATVYLYKKHVVKEFSDTEDLKASLPKTSPLADQTVILDRKVYSGWNTFCVPFALTQTQLEEAYGSGAVAKYLSGVTTDGAAATLHFTPEEGGGIEANKAYLLYLTADVTEAKTFSDVTLQPAGDCTTTVRADNGGDYTFQGILAPTALATNDRQYFLNSAGTYFVLPLNNTSQMKATRAYIIVPAPAAPAQGRQYSFDFNGTTTAIDNVNVSGMEDGAWYTISGIRINRPAAKGVYIHNGRKVIVK